MRRTRTTVVVLVGVGLLAASGCANRHQKDMNDAKADYDACVSEHSAEHPECKELLATYKVAQERYEENARRRWTCDPTSDECPRKR